MKNSNQLCAKLTRSFLRKWWLVIILSLVFLMSGIFVILFFSTMVNFIIDKQITLTEGSQTYDMWRKPPVHPIMRVYIYNVTNADQFLNDGQKPFLHEIGPYVYEETWEKVNLNHHKNGTLTFNQKKTFRFVREWSVGGEEDMVIIPNIPMLSATTQSKYAARFLRLAMASIMDILKIKPFVEVSVGQLLWGYEDPLLKLAKDVVPKDTKLPFEEFGLLYGKNGTEAENITVFTGENDITQFGIVNKFNGRSAYTNWKNEKCNRIGGSDGSVFPPHMNYNTTLHIFNKDLCRLLPLSFDKEIITAGGIKGYRFIPSESALQDVSENPDNICFCPSGPPCTPKGMFNVSSCQLDSPVLLSFPHFYKADDYLRKSVDGLSPPNASLHEFYVDIQPEMGVALSAKARLQINLAVSQVGNIKQVSKFPSIIFPIMWFEDGIESLPDNVNKLLKLATETPMLAKTAMTLTFLTIGCILLIISIFCLIRSSNRTEVMNLEGTAHYTSNDFRNRSIRKSTLNNHRQQISHEKTINGVVINRGYVSDYH